MGAARQARGADRLGVDLVERGHDGPDGGEMAAQN